MIQHPWLTLLISVMIIGLFIFLVYFGMFRFESRKYFYLFWVVIGLYTAFGVYFALRAETYLLFFGPVLITVFMFIRDRRKLNRLLIKR